MNANSLAALLCGRRWRPPRPRSRITRSRRNTTPTNRSRSRARSRRSSGPIRTSIIFADVEDEKSGEVVNWAFEMGGPNALIRRGWTRNSLKPDDLVTFEGSLARDGSRLVNARSLVMTESGRRMFAGSSGGDEPPASTPR